MDHDKTGCQPPPQGPILCINNCGFFGSAANMNMCSKCYKDMILNQEQAIENIVNESTKRNGKEPVEADIIDMQTDSLGVQSISLPSSQVPSYVDAGESKREEGPSRCHSCKKRVGLTGFNCRCGNTFCGSHRYSDKHNCPFDYRTAAQDAIAKANPLIRAEKLDKI